MRYTLLFLCALLLFSGCTPANDDRAGFFPKASPTFTPTPAHSAAQLAEDFVSLWRESLTINVAPLLPQSFFDAEAPWQVFDASQEERAWLPAMEAAVMEELEASAQRAELAFSKAHAGLSIKLDKDMACPSWQLLCALIQGSGSAEAANALIENAVVLSAEAAFSQKALLLSISASPVYYRQALRLNGEDDGAFWSRCFSFSYMYTVYGPDASEAEYRLPPAECSLKEGIVWPLKAHTRLRKTWYADRNGGLRRHTGTDIWADADTEIYSCTNGRVTYVGEGKGTGFAVIITDSCGYEYHYYHMIRLSGFIAAGDEVKAGDLIGHVGNTGNSDLDHLHLTIVAPNGKYINPYGYLKAVEPELQ